jgi:hypothetical protein
MFLIPNLFLLIAFQLLDFYMGMTYFNILFLLLYKYYYAMELLLVNIK